MTDVVFLHGIGTGPQGWSPQVEALSSGGDAVFAPNLTGGFARGWEATIEEVAMLVAGRDRWSSARASRSCPPESGDGSA